jgi:hypothetical protein
MTDRLDDRIRGFVAELVNDPPATPEIDFEGMESPSVGPLRQSPSRPRRVPVVVAVSAACVMLIAVGLPVLFFSGSVSNFVVGSGATVPPTVTTVAPVVPTTPMTWDRIDDTVVFGGDGGVRLMMDIAVGDGIVVAVGADGAPDGQFFDAAVWYSVDGVAWNRVPHDEAVFGGDGHQRMNSVVALESGFVAVGSDGDKPGLPGSTFPGDMQDLAFDTDSLGLLTESNAAVWRSDDGISWMRLPHVDAFSEADGSAVMSDVAVGESGLVAVGLVYGQTEPFATYRLGELPDLGGGDPAEPSDVVIDVDAAVWRSVDGVSWSRVHDEDETFGGDTVRQTMNAVTAGGPGFVAVGQEGFDFLGFDEWTPTSGNNTDGRDHVADNVAAVWTSPDGETWTRVANEPSLAHSGGEVTGWATMSDIAPHAQGLVAVGRDLWVVEGYPYPAGVNAVWLSADGLSWRRAVGAVDMDDNQPDMAAITVIGDGTLVAGGGMFHYSTAGTWISQNSGNTWVMHPYEPFLNGTIQGLAVFGDKVLAVGSYDDGGDFFDAAVWVGTLNDTDG